MSRDPTPLLHIACNSQKALIAGKSSRSINIFLSKPLFLL